MTSTTSAGLTSAGPTSDTAQVAAALGLHHTLNTAMADLVDNAVDAGAGQVLVRFMSADGVIEGIRIIDDGAGMTPDELDAAMAYRRRSGYRDTDLGHFGVGLKAASFSQADTLVVWSSTARSAPAGRRLQRAAPTEISTEDTASAAEQWSNAHPRFPMATGTVVEWRRLRGALTMVAADERDAWLETVITEVRAHLGVVFHRRIAAGFRITLDVYDVGARRAGPQRAVAAIDPFGYPRSGHPDYPQPRAVAVGTRTLAVTLHLWPARSSLPQFRIGGAPGRDLQGLYVYRNDRLLQIGGWNELIRGRTEFGLARVALELPSDLLGQIVINPEKAGVTLDATAAQALRTALGAAAGPASPPAGYLADAVTLMRAARSTRPRPITLVEPESGLPEDVLDEIADVVDFTGDADPVRIGWRALARDAFFEVDLTGRTLWLNARYRRILVGGRSVDNTDLPVVRALLFLLTQEMFAGVRHSRRERETMRAWQAILIAAVTAHQQRAAEPG